MRVFVDTAPLIYLCEGRNPVLNKVVASQFRRWILAETALGSSTLTLLELLVGPHREGNRRLALKYRALLSDLLSDPLISLSEPIADRAARYRAEYGYKTPDAVQLATAVEHGYDIFYTNDRRLIGFADVDILCCGESSGTATE